ncbi:MAG: hypothetical protein GY847_34945, partial [Proteobacteria bacterium]|nr:hypothetical protein [Pseudomonadota bacterium]
LWLRANRLLKRFHNQLKNELSHLRTALISSKNGYPPRTVDRWFADFDNELRARPEMLRVRSRLSAGDILDNFGQQKFVWPKAEHRFPMCGEEGTVSQASTPGGNLVDENGQAMDNEEDLGEEVVRDVRPVVVLPFVPVLGERLKKAASDAGFRTWFSYPGKVYEMFSEHRG